MFSVNIRSVGVLTTIVRQTCVCARLCEGSSTSSPRRAAERVGVCVCACVCLALGRLCGVGAQAGGGGGGSLGITLSLCAYANVLGYECVYPWDRPTVAGTSHIEMDMVTKVTPSSQATAATGI